MDDTDRTDEDWAESGYCTDCGVSTDLHDDVSADNGCGSAARKATLLASFFHLPHWTATSRTYP